jgi:hypothetical protein
MAEVLILDVVKPKKHKLSPHRFRNLGTLTNELFKQQVNAAFNGASATGNGHILYLANQLPSGRIRLVAKLFQAKRNQVGKKSYSMFSTFNHPDGTILQKKAGVSSLFERADQAYPSRPPVSREYASVLRKSRYIRVS